MQRLRLPAARALVAPVRPRPSRLVRQRASDPSSPQPEDGERKEQVAATVKVRPPGSASRRRVCGCGELQSCEASRALPRYCRTWEVEERARDVREGHRSVRSCRLSQRFQASKALPVCACAPAALMPQLRTGAQGGERGPRDSA